MPDPWEKYQGSSSSALPWEKYAYAAAEPAPKERSLEATIKGGLQGATLGAVPQIAGGLEAAGSAIGIRGLGGQSLGDIRFANDAERQQSIVDAYRQARDAKRKEYGQLEAESPKAFLGGNLLGGLVTPIPGGAPKTALQALGKGAGIGAVAGFNTSTADITRGQIPEALADTATGAALGGGLGAGLHGAIKAAPAAMSAIPKKLANVFLDAPEEVLETYIKNPAAVRAAPTRFDYYKQQFEPAIEKLKTEVTEGSQASRDILAREGKEISSDRISKVFGNKAEEIARRSEGVMDDPQISAAYSWLKDTAGKYDKSLPKGFVGPAEKPTISANRVKDTIQGIDRQVDWQTGPGQFGRIAEGPKKEVRSVIDKILKDESPAYAEQMRGVAKDTQLLSDVTDVAKSPQSWTNVFRRVETDKFGAGQVPKETLEKFGERMGMDVLGDLKKSLAREAFDKTAIQGSRKVAAFEGVGGAVAGEKGKMLGKLAGAVADKYGRPMARSAVDATVKLNQLYQQSGAEAFISKMQPIIDAARSGNTDAALIYQLVSQTNPEAMKYVEK